ncbi:MAG: hypothetical protein HFF39_08185 [Lawsonibacter sp.]|nr:hypothetical protein [Lawsonibacter sp.]
MKKVSFEEIGAVTATFAVQEGTSGGQVVKVTGQGEAGPCAAGEDFCGVALEGRDGFAAVQVKGFAQVKAAGALEPGWVKLTADGQGGVQAAAGESGGREFLVVETDSTAGTAVLYL